MLTISNASDPEHAETRRFREFADEQPNCGSCERQTQSEWRGCLVAVRELTAPQARIAQERTWNSLGRKMCRGGIAIWPSNTGTRPTMRRRGLLSWRREWDSNPRYLAVHTLSKRAP